MSRQNALLTKAEVRSPAVFLFAAVFVLAVILSMLSSPSQGLVYVGLSVGIVFLVWLILDVTKEMPVADIQVREPWLELAFGCLMYLVFEFTPPLNFGDKWSLGEVLKKGLLFLILPYVFLRLRKHPPSSMGLSLSNGKQNLKVASIVLACMAIPSGFFISDTADLILGGQIALTQAVPALVIYFLHNVVRSGLPEEFFYRVFVQTRLSQVLKSRLGGILITSLLFGLTHIPHVIKWYPEMTLSEAFCSAFFIQGFMGLVHGVLWERTHNLMPGTIVHSGINALNNVGDAVALIFQ
jgi:membrane protease YdiL (CAAX protease family)